MEFIRENIQGFIALLALGISLWHLRIYRRHNEKSVTPHLHIDINHSPEGLPIKWVLKNNGIGPAIITEFMIFAGERELLFPKLEDFKSLLLTIGIDNCDNFHLFTLNDYLDQSGKTTLLSFSNEDARKYATNIAKLSWHITYTCVYGKKHKLFSAT